jgi:hypothetical protein
MAADGLQPVGVGYPLVVVESAGDGRPGPARAPYTIAPATARLSVTSGPGAISASTP